MSTEVDRKRIQKELKDCQKDMATSGIKAKLVDEADLMHWKGEINGPVGTPYEGGKFVVDIVLLEDYPFVPPKMKFETKVWHPNVSSQSGAICLDILKNQWSPALTIRTALISLQALLSAAEPNDPQDAVVAKQYKESRAEFDKTAKFWTDTYASGVDDGFALKLQKIVDMGFDAPSAKAALEATDGDEGRALERLLGGGESGAEHSNERPSDPQPGDPPSGALDEQQQQQQQPTDAPPPSGAEQGTEQGAGASPSRPASASAKAASKKKGGAGKKVGEAKEGGKKRGGWLSKKK